jgi:hypothetical protein
MPAEDFIFYRSVKTVMDISGPFLLMEINGLTVFLTEVGQSISLTDMGIFTHRIG